MTQQLAFSRSMKRADAPTVVLLGSLGSNRSMWAPQVRGLAEAHDVVAVDLRGHGESPTPRGPYTIEELAGDVCDLLDRLGLDAVHLVGLSLGGAIAQWIAAHQASRAATLTLLCTSAYFGAPQIWLDRAAAVRSAGTGSIAEAIIARWFTPALLATDHDLVERAKAMILDTDAEGYAGCCEAIAGWDGRSILGQIAAPTLAIAGAQDPATPPAGLAYIADGIAHAELHVLDGAAHLANVEQPETVTQLITTHVASHGSPAACRSGGEKP